MPRELHDHYFREAKREGYRSRAAYKLIEIDDRKRLLRHGDRVLDLGCAPGSWLQVAARRVGRRGRVVGVDRRPVQPKLVEDNVEVMCDDVSTVEPDVLLEAGPRGQRGRFDVVLSDLAPATTGAGSADHHRSVRLCEHVLDLCRDVLEPGGRLVMKVLEGEAYPGLVARCRRGFAKVKGFKPKASRGESTEMYVVAEGYRGHELPPPENRKSAEPEIELPRGRPSRGWDKKVNAER